MEEELSIEETNKLRLSLGLKPLKTSQESNKSSEITIVPPSKKEEKIKAQIEKSKMSRLRNQKLKGPTLADGDDEDLNSWAHKLSTRRDHVIKKPTVPVTKYNKSELVGMTIGHEVDDLMERDTILVLEDSFIGDDDDKDDPRLVNINISNLEKSRKAVQFKKPKIREDDEECSGILSKYDDEVNGERKISLKIGKSGRVDGISKIELEKEKEKEMKANTLTLDYDKMQPVQDYYTHDEVKIKKPKKKKDKSHSKKLEPIDHELVSFSHFGKRKNQDEEINLVDDDDLQLALSLERKKNQVKVKLNGEDMIKKANDLMDTFEEQEEIETNGLVIDDMSEFVNSLSTIVTNKPQKSQGTTTINNKSLQSNITNEDMMQVDEQVDEIDHMNTIKDDEIEDSNELEKEIEFIKEPLVASGLGATLQLLNQKGLVQKPTNLVKSTTKPHLLSKTKDPLKRDYVPNVEIHYNDEFGRSLTPKEAFKQLSHKFHGFSSGKNKTDKKLKRIQDEIKDGK